MHNSIWYALAMAFCRWLLGWCVELISVRPKGFLVLGVCEARVSSHHDAGQTEISQWDSMLFGLEVIVSQNAYADKRRTGISSFLHAPTYAMSLIFQTPS